MAPSKDEEAASSISPNSVLGDYSPLRSQPLSSATSTFANLVFCIVGVGLLGLPYTFSNVGYVMGILTLVVGGAVSFHGMMLQLYSKRRLQRSRGELDLIIASYGDLAFHAFGHWGRFSVDVLLTLGVFAGSIAHISFISQNFASIAASIQGTHIQGMELQGSHLDFDIGSVYSAVLPCAGLLNSSHHENWSTVRAKNPNLHATSRIAAHAHFTLSDQYMMHQNQSSYELVFENQSLAESIDLHNGSSPAAGSMSVNDHHNRSLVHKYWAGINWTSSPATYTWCIFPLLVALGAIPSITALAPLSTVGTTVNVVALAAVMVCDVLAIMVQGPQNFKAFGDLAAVPSGFGVGVYAFQASGIVIPIETAMEQPSKLGSVLGLAFILIGLLYATFAVLGYAAFGTTTQQIITLNLQAGIEAVLIKAALSVSMCLAFPLVLIPMVELVERRFSRRKRSLGLRALIVFLICVLATAVTQFADFLSLAGSSISCLLGFILPAAVHIKVMKEDGHKPPSHLLYVADYLLIAFGLILGACGTTLSFLKFF